MSPRKGGSSTSVTHSWGHVMYNDSTTPDTEKSFKAVGIVEMDNVLGGCEKQEHVRGVRDLRQRPLLRRVHPLVRANTR